MLKTLKSMFGGAVPSVSPQDAKPMIKAGALVIDVREPAEVERSGKVKGAVNIPVGQIAAAANQPGRLPKDRPIIVYCASGMRSANAANTLHGLGYEKAYNLGAFSAWAAAGGETEKA